MQQENNCCGCWPKQEALQLQKWPPWSGRWENRCGQGEGLEHRRMSEWGLGSRRAGVDVSSSPGAMLTQVCPHPASGVTSGEGGEGSWRSFQVYLVKNRTL